MEKSLKIPQEYNCKYCNYITCSFKDFNKHLHTNKHLNRTNLNNLEQNILENPKEYKCKICNKSYKARNSLWYHEQKCNIQEINNDEPSDKQLILQILKQNSELIKENSELRKEQTDIKELILEIVKKWNT